MPSIHTKTVARWAKALDDATDADRAEVLERIRDALRADDAARCALVDMLKSPYADESILILFLGLMEDHSFFFEWMSNCIGYILLFSLCSISYKRKSCFYLSLHLDEVSESYVKHLIDSTKDLDVLVSLVSNIVIRLESYNKDLASRLLLHCLRHTRVQSDVHRGRLLDSFIIGAESCADVFRDVQQAGLETHEATILQLALFNCGGGKYHLSRDEIRKNALPSAIAIWYYHHFVTLYC